MSAWLIVAVIWVVLVLVGLALVHGGTKGPR